MVQIWYRNDNRDVIPLSSSTVQGCKAKVKALQSHCALCAVNPPFPLPPFPPDPPPISNLLISPISFSFVLPTLSELPSAWHWPGHLPISQLQLPQSSSWWSYVMPVSQILLFRCIMYDVYNRIPDSGIIPTVLHLTRSTKSLNFLHITRRWIDEWMVVPPRKFLQITSWTSSAGLWDDPHLMIETLREPHRPSLLYRRDLGKSRKVKMNEKRRKKKQKGSNCHLPMPEPETLNSEHGPLGKSTFFSDWLPSSRQASIDADGGGKNSLSPEFPQ